MCLVVVNIDVVVQQVSPEQKRGYPYVFSEFSAHLCLFALPNISNSCQKDIMLILILHLAKMYLFMHKL